MTDSDLITLITHAYAMREQDVATLAAHLATARLAAMQRAYRKAQRTVHASPLWEPTQQDSARAHQQAHKAAESIAETYQTLLSHFLERVLEVEKQRKGLSTASWTDLYGTVREAVRDLVGKVKTFVSDLAGWKSEQVANYTCGQGNYDGTGAFIVDLESGDVIDSETGEVVQGGDYAIQCLPAESSSDVCSTVAGQTFDISEWSDLPEMPNHGNCDHEYIIVSV